MNVYGKRVVLTGASGGIGADLARQLAARGATVVLVGRRQRVLEALSVELVRRGGMGEVCVADLDQPGEIARLAREVMTGGLVDLLIHCAGRQAFGALDEQGPEALAALMHTNVTVPMQLTQALLPALRHSRGRVVAVGSIFGSIAFPCYAAYSASKFALRGFCQALRRELDGSGVGVTYVAPRYTRTALNAGPAEAAARALKMNQDEPADVARWICSAIERERDEAYFGWPERLFVRINALLPWLVDGSLRKQTPQLLAFSRQPQAIAVASPPRLSVTEQAR